jgi:acyl-coenzyme A thioesterase PaaI-like protein
MSGSVTTGAAQDRTPVMSVPRTDPQIHYVAPAHAGDLLTATARETSRWGRNGLYDVEVHNDRGILIAQFRGTSRTIERRDS